MKRLPFRQRLTNWSTIVAAVALIVSGIITALDCGSLLAHSRKPGSSATSANAQTPALTQTNGLLAGH